MSRGKRKTVVNKKEIESIMYDPGYNIYLPATWKHHGQTRILVYAREELKVKERELEAALNDLPMLTFEIGFGGERKTIVNYFYQAVRRTLSALVTLTCVQGSGMTTIITRKIKQSWYKLSYLTQTVTN